MLWQFAGDEVHEVEVLCIVFLPFYSKMSFSFPLYSYLLLMEKVIGV